MFSGASEWGETIQDSKREQQPLATRTTIGTENYGCVWTIGQICIVGCQSAMTTVLMRMGRSRHCSAADRFRQPEFVSPLVVHMSRFASVVSPFAIILSSSYGSPIWSSASKKVGILCQVFSPRRVYTLPMEIIKSIVTSLPMVGAWALEFGVVGMNGIDKGVRLRGWDWSGTWVYSETSDGDIHGANFQSIRCCCFRQV